MYPSHRCGFSLRVAATALAGVFFACAGGQSGGFAPTAATPEAPPPAPDPWPRSLQTVDASVLVYQPQVESWEGNQLGFRAAVASTPDGSSRKAFGVVWGTARTDVDRVLRQVSLYDVALTRANFPTLPDHGASLLTELQQELPAAAPTISLDRLLASLAAAGAHRPGSVAVENAPPRVFVRYAPAILVPIDGAPAWRIVPGTNFSRVMNTRALILRAASGGNPYLHVYDGWLTAPALAGPWGLATSPPVGIDLVASGLGHQGMVDLLDGRGAEPPPSLANGVPEIIVSGQQAELVLFRGQPDYQPIGQTSLLWATNTRSYVVVDSANGGTYVLLAGRWYRAASLDGPWSFVPGTGLPADFARIPPDSPAGVVLATVAGTPQAHEALIENSLPQTASVPLQGGPGFSAVTDGAPQLRPIPGTPLQYVVNAPTPILRVAADSWYALRAGVWFSAASLEGPWVVAGTVPAVIYTIPPSSPLYYVTYVEIYGGGPDVVYEGYTPGYLGTVATADGVVVYGTGYEYQPWIGSAWYAPPETWGLMAQPVYNPALGWAYGFGLGLTTAAVADSWAAPVYYSSYYHGYPCCGTASANVYGHWGNTVTSGTRSWYDTASGTYGTRATGSYANERTGTTGTYSGSRSYNPWTGQGQASTHRSFDTAGGTTGNVSRGASYDWETGKASYGSSMSAQGAGGSSVARNTSYSAGPGDVSASRETTVDNARTGQTNTYSSGFNDGDRYAGADGNVYQNDGSGWQHTSGSGWQGASGDTSWADGEQQARSASQSRFGSAWGGGGGGFGGGGFGGDRLGGGGFGGGDGWGDRFGGGGFGDRFGEGGRFGGGGFGGGGFGGGFRGRR